jgi:membrane protease YdiL (CAAX protease family)
LPAATLLGVTTRPLARSFATSVWDWVTTPSPDVITDADRKTIELVGLRLPIRASIAIAIATVVLLIDFSRILLPPTVVAFGRSPDGLRGVALERLVLFGLVPLLIVVAAFRDRPERYGLTIGDRTAGTFLTLAGAAAMTPIVLWFATLPEVRAYYAPSAAPLPQVVLTNAIDLIAAEFLFRGFLMFTLVRTIGPIGVLIAVMPFAYAHVGKPALELLSTLGGGLAYGWLAWRTRSILWGSIAHVYIMSLVIAAASAGG